MSTIGDQTFDITARKFHQIVCVLLIAVAFVAGKPLDLALLAVVGLVLAAGRYWWPADLLRQFVWRVLEPSGILRRREVVEDHETRRVARVLGGLVLLASAVLIAFGAQWAWIPALLIAVMISLDAAFDFCALCAVTHTVARVQATRLSGNR